MAEERYTFSQHTDCWKCKANNDAVAHMTLDDDGYEAIIGAAPYPDHEHDGTERPIPLPTYRD